jgi:hypothetical protein
MENRATKRGILRIGGDKKRSVSTVIACRHSNRKDVTNWEINRMGQIAYTFGTQLVANLGWLLNIRVSEVI